MRKAVNLTSGFLGIAMFLFGVLKFVDPFKTWYRTQVVKSELPFQVLSYWAGQLGEIFVGLLLLLFVIPNNFLKSSYKKPVFLLSNILIVLMMLAAIYVHLHPRVPASVLPLKIRPPFIPGFFLVLALVNIYWGKNTVHASGQIC